MSSFGADYRGASCGSEGSNSSDEKVAFAVALEKNGSGSAADDMQIDLEYDKAEIDFEAELKAIPDLLTKKIEDTTSKLMSSIRDMRKTERL